MNDAKQTLVSEFERLRDLIRAMGPIRDGAGTVDPDPDPRIAAAEEMAKRLEDLIAVIGFDRDTRSAQYALAAWNALK